MPFPGIAVSLATTVRPFAPRFDQRVDQAVGRPDAHEPADQADGAVGYQRRRRLGANRDFHPVPFPCLRSRERTPHR